MTTYTVKKLATISGVSVRTLHWYDEVGLLKPAYCNNKGYRFYEKEQLLLLQQILFFREVGFKLDDIQNMLGSDDFDKIKILRAHKATMEKGVHRMRKLIDTIDKTIIYLQGEYNMQDKDLYVGFDLAKQKEYEQYLVQSYSAVAEDLIHESKKRTTHWKNKDWQYIKDEGDAIYTELSKWIDRDVEPRDSEVQKIIARHYQMIEQFYTASKDVYIGLGQLYCENPEFRKFFDAHHPKLAEFMGEAMSVYAMKHL